MLPLLKYPASGELEPLVMLDILAMDEPLHSSLSCSPAPRVSPELPGNVDSETSTLRGWPRSKGSPRSARKKVSGVGTWGLTFAARIEDQPRDSRLMLSGDRDVTGRASKCHPFDAMEAAGRSPPKEF
jgi:hypothetical protein